MTAAGDVKDIGGTEESVHSLGDKAAIPRVARCLDAGFARCTDGFTANALIGGGESGAGEQRFGRRRVAARQENGRRSLPLCLEQGSHALDRGAYAGHYMDA